MHRIVIKFITFVFLIGCETNNSSTNTTDGDTVGDTGGDVSSNSLNIDYDIQTPIAGFQFNVDGVEVIGASGGAAGAAGFTILTSATTVIGYTFSTPIPSGKGVFIVLDIEGNITDACLSHLVLGNIADACLIDNINFVFSDTEATSLNATIQNCTTINIP